MQNQRVVEQTLSCIFRIIQMLLVVLSFYCIFIDYLNNLIYINIFMIKTNR
jgi:hypothetical protein